MAKAKAPVKKEKGPGKRGLYEIKGDKVTRTKKHCPKCGPGVFLADHKDRAACGRCGYTEFKAKA